jgi:hypothetical protein
VVHVRTEASRQFERHRATRSTAAARSLSLELNIGLHQAGVVEGSDFQCRSSFNSKSVTRPKQAGASSGSDGVWDNDGSGGRRS